MYSNSLRSHNLKLHADTPTTQNTVTAYGPGFVEINRMRHTTHVVVTPDQVEPGRSQASKRSTSATSSTCAICAARSSFWEPAPGNAFRIHV